MSAEQTAERVGDLRGRERPGGDLIRERLEQVEVTPVDKRDPDRQMGEVKRGLKSAESAADDDDVGGESRGAGTASAGAH